MRHLRMSLWILPYGTTFQHVSQRNRAVLGQFHGPDVGQAHGDFGVIGTQRSQEDLECGGVGVDTGGYSYDLLVVGRGDADELVVSAGVVEQLDNGFVLHAGI